MYHKTVKIPKELAKILTKTQIKLLRHYLNGAGINEIVSNLKIKRKQVIKEFIELGRRLAIFELLFCKVYPDLTSLNKKYINGFRDFRVRLIEELVNAKTKKR